MDHRKTDEALTKQDGWVDIGVSNQRIVITTKGWNLCIDLIDGSVSWTSLSILKESNPLGLAQYAVENKIQHEPAFSWWVPHTLSRAKVKIK